MQKEKISYLKLVRTFLFLGASSFGGYTSLVAMIQKKMVDEDKLIDEKLIYDGITIASILPGPLAVNVVTYIGYFLRGWTGALLCMFAVIFPSFCIMIVLAELYMTYNYIPQVESFMAGVNPVIAAVILSVSYNMFKKQVQATWQRILFLSTTILLFFFSGYNMLLIGIAAGGLMGYFFGEKKVINTSVSLSHQLKRATTGALIIVLIASVGFIMLAPELQQLFQVFAKISITLFGGGYVMIPVIHDIVVNQLLWLSAEEFSRAIAFGQITPGPILVSSTYIGYKTSGLAGAIVSTIGIFVPSALIMVLGGIVYDYFKEYKIINAILTGIRPVVVAFIFFSAYILLESNDIDTFSFIALAISFLLLTYTKINFSILILIAGLISIFLH